MDKYSIPKWAEFNDLEKQLSHSVMQFIRMKLYFMCTPCKETGKHGHLSAECHLCVPLFLFRVNNLSELLKLHAFV